MNILDLADELNLCPKKATSTNGGEYKSMCPKCKKGKDRFCIWPNQGNSGRYWCRVCQTNGDAIQFCRDFLGMSFHQACQKINMTPDFKKNPFKEIHNNEVFTPAPDIPVCLIWQESAGKFISSTHKNLLNNPLALETLYKRGFSLDIIRMFSLGFNDENLFLKREEWGLLNEVRENGSLKALWIPKGFVIPSYSGGKLIKIKIRRSDWNENDTLPKYVEISGSKNSLSVYGDVSKPVIIVESELDAMLIQQVASHLLCSVALGGISKKPDDKIHRWLKGVPLILLSMDFDEAGKSKCLFWMKLYPNLRVWPTPEGKSFGDFFKNFQTSSLDFLKTGLSF